MWRIGWRSGVAEAELRVETRSYRIGDTGRRAVRLTGVPHHGGHLHSFDGRSLTVSTCRASRCAAPPPPPIN
jgi:hypothetical protein